MQFCAMKKNLLSILFLTTCISALAQLPTVEFVTPRIVRVRWNPEATVTDNATGACVWQAQPVEIKTAKDGDDTVMSSEYLKVTVGENGAISFAELKDGKDVVLLKSADTDPYVFKTVAREHVVYDDNSSHVEETANGKVTVKDVLYRDTIGENRMFRISFLTKGDEGLYGLGSHMEDYMNLTGKTLYLTQHNLKAFIPMIVSTAGYGLLFDAGCSMKFESIPAGGKDNNSFLTTMELEAANTVDYYFILGPDARDVVSGYRYLTGNVSMMPRYLFGYTQSKERYVSSEDIINTLKEYRRRHVPIDMIVQDWNYWPEGWGYMKMNPKYYPDPKALADSVHALNAKLMVSIWPNPQYCPEADDFRSRGFMLEHAVYDAFNPEARDLYWDYANKEFFSNGFDSWWCDSSEPVDGDWNQIPGDGYSWDDHERRWQLNDARLSEALTPERACLYSLYHSKGIYEHQRRATDRKRVVNLTRSTFAGQQRYGTVVWNGDTHASWKSFRRQIPAGLNYMATGNPYWTVDVGCFFTREDPRWFYKGDFPEGVKDDAYREFYTRMFQWATFLPVLRSHGSDTPREIWQFGEPGTPYYDAILGMINQRYQLIPYIYSMAAQQTTGGYSMARPLAFDFPNDKSVYDIKDQYMFGDIMACPVTSPGATDREVYLPETDGGWIDFWTGNRIDGGQKITAAAPIDRLPLFVRGGSIILTTDPVEYSGLTEGKPVTVNVYPGQDAEFTLYDDAGDNYDFEKGESMRITMKWDDKNNRLTIADAIGTYGGAPSGRTFIVTNGDKVKRLNYTGKKTTVKL